MRRASAFSESCHAAQAASPSGSSLGSVPPADQMAHRISRSCKDRLLYREALDLFEPTWRWLKLR